MSLAYSASPNDERILSAMVVLIQKQRITTQNKFNKN